MEEFSFSLHYVNVLRSCIFHWAGQGGGDKEVLERCPIRIIEQSEAFMVIFK
jgi:hypothetical protein